jgi:hypothetical protein
LNVYSKSRGIEFISCDGFPKIFIGSRELPMIRNIRRKKRGLILKKKRGFQAISLALAFLTLISILASLATYNGSTHLKGGDEHMRVAAFWGESVVIALTVMAIIQIVRRLLPLRGWFHERKVFHWLGNNSYAMDALRTQVKRYESLAVFDLPIEHLCAQLSAIGDHLMDELSLSGEEGNRESNALLVRMSAGTWERKALDFQSDKGEAKGSLAAMRTRAAYATQRNLYQLQIETGASWRRWLLGFAICLSGLLFILAVLLLGAGSFIKTWKDEPPGLIFVSYLAGTLLVSIFAGYMASIARDLVAIIEKLRRQ